MTWIMLIGKHPFSLCFSFLINFFVMVYDCRTGRGLHCVTQLCIAVAWCLGIYFFYFLFWDGGVSMWALLTGALWDERIGRDWQLGFFSVFHCLISILSPAVRKTNYVFNPLLHPPPLLFRSSHLEIIMSLWQTTLALEKGREKNSESPFACIQTGRGQLQTTFWPSKAVTLNSFRAWPTLSLVLHTC